MIEEYVNTGVVRFGYVSMAFLNQASTQSAIAAECAAEQDEAAFWEYHDKLFENLVSDSRLPINSGTLGQFALELGLDGEAFSQCLGSGRYTAQIQEMTRAAGSFGVESIPTFYINGQWISGAKPFEVFQEAIEAAAGILPAQPTQTSIQSPPSPSISPTSGRVTLNEDKMEAAIARVRHWRGDEAAPVIFIEFSNFL